IPRVACSVKPAICIKLPSLAGNPCQHARLDAGEIGADQHVAGCRGDHAAAAITNNCERLWIQAPHVLIVAGGDSSDRCIVNRGPFQVLRLKICAGPAPGRGAVVAKSTADTIIIAGNSEERSDLLRRGLSSTEPEFEDTPDGWRQIIITAVEEPLDRAPIEAFQFAIPLLQPLQQLCYLVDRGNGAGGDLGELSVDLRGSRLRNLPSSFGKGSIDVKTARIDSAAQLPQHLLRRCQSGQPRMELSFDLDVLP